MHAGITREISAGRVYSGWNEGIEELRAGLQVGPRPPHESHALRATSPSRCAAGAA